MIKTFVILFLCLFSFISFSQGIKKDSTIKMVYLGSPNSVGGVDVAVNWFNYSENVVKYITFTLTPYNAVDDVCFCSVTRKSTLSLKATGPFEKGFQSSPNGGGAWSDVWYNNDIAYCRLTKVTIQFMNGGTKIISLNKKSSNDFMQYIDMIQSENLKKRNH